MVAEMASIFDGGRPENK
jgi:hypothetical protein